VAFSSSGRCCTPVAWRAATRADTVPACRLGARSPWRSTSTLDSTTPPVSRWLACTGVVARSSSGRVLHPPWPGAWPPAPTRCPCAASASGARSPWRSTSTLDRTTPPASRGLVCAGVVALSSSGGCCTPRGVARGHPRRHGARVPPRRPVALAEHLDTGQHHTFSLEVVGWHRGCGAQLEWRALHPPWRGARPPAPTRCPCAASVPGRPGGAPRHWTAPHLQPRGDWLAQGLWRSARVAGAAPPWRGARPPAPTRGPRAASAPGRPGGAPRHWTAPHLQSRGGWLAQGLWRGARVGGCCTPPRGVARGHLRRHGARVPPRPWAPGRTAPSRGAPRHWTAPHLQPRGGWLAQGLWRGARVGGCCTPPPWRGAWPPAPTPCPCAASALGARSPWRSTSTLDSTTPPVSRWLACTGVVALSSSGGRCTPRGVVRGHPRRHGARPRRAASALDARSPWRSTSTLDSTTPPAPRGLACTGAVALSSSGGCCTPRGPARGHPRRHGVRVPRRPWAPGRTAPSRGAPRHWTALHLQPRGCWLAQGMWRGARVAGAAPPVTRRAATRADTVSVCRVGLGRPVALHPVAEHLDTGQHHTSSLEVVGLHRGCGAELEWRVLNPPWRGARPPSPTRCPCAASALGAQSHCAQSRSTSTLDSTAPPASRLLACTGDVARSSSGGRCTPPHPPPCGLARGHPRRHGARVPPRPWAPGRPGGAPRHWTAPHLQPRCGWLAQGLWRSARVAGAAPPGAWRAATRADTVPVCRLGLGRPVALAEHLDTGQLQSRGGWLAQGAVALSSSGGRCTPRGVARGQPRRHGARVPPRLLRPRAESIARCTRRSLPSALGQSWARHTRVSPQLKARGERGEHGERGERSERRAQRAQPAPSATSAVSAERSERRAQQALERSERRAQQAPSAASAERSERRAQRAPSAASAERSERRAQRAPSGASACTPWPAPRGRTPWPHPWSARPVLGSPQVHNSRPRLRVGGQRAERSERSERSERRAQRAPSAASAERSERRAQQAPSAASAERSERRAQRAPSAASAERSERRVQRAPSAASAERSERRAQRAERAPTLLAAPAQAPALLAAPAQARAQRYPQAHAPAATGWRSPAHGHRVPPRRARARTRTASPGWKTTSGSEWTGLQ